MGGTASVPSHFLLVIRPEMMGRTPRRPSLPQGGKQPNTRFSLPDSNFPPKPLPERPYKRENLASALVRELFKSLIPEIGC